MRIHFKIQDSERDEQLPDFAALRAMGGVPPRFFTSRPYGER